MMKKPALAALGVVGACAACCAIPLALPVLGGLSALGVTGFSVGALGVDRDVGIVAAAVALAAVSGGITWWRMRSKTPTCATEPAKTAPGMASGSCGCGSGTQGGCK